MKHWTHRARRAALSAFAPVGERFSSPWIMKWVWLIPSLVSVWKTSPHAVTWVDDLPPIPPELQSSPGVRRDSVAEQQAFDENPLHEYSQVYSEINRFNLRKLWPVFVPCAPKMARELRRLRREEASKPTSGNNPDPDSRALTRELRGVAAELGITAIGVAPYDEKYIFSKYHGRAVGDRIVVCIQEKPGDTGGVPSYGFGRKAIATALDVDNRAMNLSGFLRSKGYRARCQGHSMHGMALHFGVEAGLGQMGLNGQLLTPFAGSRTTFTLIDTNAPLEFDKPRDYGILGICDRCKACIRRCPARAIPGRRTMQRGVEKSKVNTSRCAPVTALADGCAICVKVCPVQRYGLKAVLEEYDRSGQILGRGTEDLEGYDWPLDGNHYGVGRLPEVGPEVFNPPGTHFVFDRKHPDKDAATTFVS
jgi:ferredoxin